MSRPQLSLPHGGQVTVPAGEYTPGNYSGLHDLTVDLSAATICGDGGRMRVNDGCSNVTVRGGRVKRLWQGWWITETDGFTLTDQEISDVTREGILTGGCKNLVVRRVKIARCGRDWGPDPHGSGLDHLGGNDDPGNHGGYDGFGGENNLWELLDIRDTVGSGFHSERNEDDGIEEHNLTIRQAVFLRNGSQGTGAWQFDCTFTGTVEGALVAFPGVGWALLGDDGGGRGVASKNWTFRRLTVFNREAKWNLRLAPGSTGNAIEDSILVLANAPLFEQQGGGEWTGELPAVKNTLIYAWDEEHVPDAVRAEPTNRIRPIAEAALLFPGAALDAEPEAYVPADATETRGWRPEGATAPVVEHAPEPTPAPAATAAPAAGAHAVGGADVDRYAVALDLARAEAAAAVLADALASIRQRIGVPAPTA